MINSSLIKPLVVNHRCTIKPTETVFPQEAETGPAPIETVSPLLQEYHRERLDQLCNSVVCQLHGC